ncbi:hypothetical protein, partial [Paenibacillus sp. IHB B 3415]|uniref:hypothetical protein n=1 Tax=Paenibacillus sp. IHB B 3415 TaxID=867080 RepID=UPI001F32083C
AQKNRSQQGFGIMKLSPKCSIFPSPRGLAGGLLYFIQQSFRTSRYLGIKVVKRTTIMPAELL